MPSERGMQVAICGAPYFWRYDQNNTGGWFDDGMPLVLWVQAETESDADARALALGVYFDGVEGGNDCECCGDRWYRVGMSDRHPIHPDARWGHVPVDDEPVYMESGEVWTGLQLRAALEGM